MTLRDDLQQLFLTIGQGGVWNFIKEHEMENTEGLVNKELHENIAKALQERYYAAINKAPETDRDSLTNVENAWLEVAKLAVARLYPTAVNSELPNDARLGSGRNPLSDDADKEIGGLVDPSVPPETKSGSKGAKHENRSAHR